MRNPYYEGPVSDHFDGIRFLNPAGEPETDRSFGEFLRWRRSAPDNRWPSSVDVTPVTPEARVDGLRVTMVGHATLLVQIAGLNKIGRASCGERVWQYVEISVVAVTCKK